MKISTKGRYGVRIMLDVARHGGEGPVRIADSALRQAVPPKYAEQITGALVKGGLLRSIRGASGGYVLARAPEQYTVGEILRCMEGNLAPTPCSESNCCDRADGCVTHTLWQGLHALTDAYLDGISLKDMLNPEFTAPVYRKVEKEK